MKIYRYFLQLHDEKGTLNRRLCNWRDSLLESNQNCKCHYNSIGQLKKIYPKKGKKSVCTKKPKKQKTKISKRGRAHLSCISNVHCTLCTFKWFCIVVKITEGYYHQIHYKTKSS